MTKSAKCVKAAIRGRPTELLSAEHDPGPRHPIIYRTLPRELRDMPVDHPRQSLPHPHGRLVSEKAPRLGDVGLRETHIAGTKLAISRTQIAQTGVMRRQQ